jgi:hypothetical protein
MSEEKVPLVAVLAAGIFAIQTMNMALPLSIVPGRGKRTCRRSGTCGYCPWFPVRGGIYSYSRPHTAGHIFWRWRNYCNGCKYY